MSGTFPIVAIGASAGGLDACEQLLATIPADSGMAYILVQHLDPHHESMLVALLAAHAKVGVCQADEGMAIEPNRLYVIPPGSHLSVTGDTLHLSASAGSAGPRLPFDHLLRSLADEHGDRAICVVLSGTGADGSLGLRAVQANGGLVVVQDPFEAAFDGMPRSAILTGAADFVLPIADMAEAIANYGRRISQNASRGDPDAEVIDQDWLAEVIDVLHMSTGHDFRHYKEGTVLRRIERRMAMAEIAGNEAERYVDRLRRRSR